MTDKRLIPYKMTYSEYVDILDGLTLLYQRNALLPDFTDEHKSRIIKLMDKVRQLADSVKE